LRRGKGKAGPHEKAGATATRTLSGTLSAVALCPTLFQEEDEMKGKLIFKLGLLAIILSFLLVIPALGQQGQTNEALGKQLKDYKAKILKDLKIAPDKEKALAALEDKYSEMRGEIVDNSKKAWDNLQAALAAPKPDNAKVKAAVAAFIDAQAKLFASFRKQLDDELAQMSPIQQGKYLVAMEKWRQQCMPKVCIPITK
jgi:Spy/CpxP family protein refolding chaperone